METEAAVLNIMGVTCETDRKWCSVVVDVFRVRKGRVDGFLSVSSDSPLHSFDGTGEATVRPGRHGVRKRLGNLTWNAKAASA